MTDDMDELEHVIEDAKRVALAYRRLTGRPLGITGEVAEFEAARILGLDLCPARQAGYDAVGQGVREGLRVQIKGRCVLDDSNPGQRVGGIKLDKPWDVVMLVLLDAELNAFEIYEADRDAVERAIREPGSKARNERGALAVSKFKSIGHCVWSVAPEARILASMTRVVKHEFPSSHSTGSQDRASGSAANAFGRHMAQLVAERLGLELLEKTSNRCRGKAGIGVIKSARLQNTYVGITKTMLPALDVVYAAIEETTNRFRIYELDRAALEQYKVEPASKSAEKLWFLKVRDIQSAGRLVGSLDISSQLVGGPEA